MGDRVERKVEVDGRLHVTELPLTGAYLNDFGFEVEDEGAQYRVQISLRGWKVLGKWDETA